ncbi:MAG: HK97 family phage prohead protease [Micavibrio sp.]|nr:HK97 family phage prohead protease [Micavibrio sp.]
MTALTLDTPFELKFASETGVFEGYASVFGVTDATGDRIEKGAFARSLEGALTMGQLPPLLWQHDPRQPIGAWREMWEDAHGLYVKGELFVSDIIRAREAYRLLQEKVVTGLSIGYRALKSHRDAEGIRVLTEIELIEVSMVTFPANDHARINRVKSQLMEGRVPTPREFETFLRDAGFSRRQAKGLVADGYKSLAPRDAAAGKDTFAAGDDAQALRDLSAVLLSLTPRPL